MNILRTASSPDSSIDFALQSTPKHVAIIMDGNGRWARERGMPATAGHRQGVKRLEELLPAVCETGIEVMTLFGFAAANWQRSQLEVSHLMQIAEEALDRFTPRCVSEGLAIEVLGRRDRLHGGLIRRITHDERATASGSRRLRVAFDYSSREAIVAAAKRLEEGCDVAAFGSKLGSAGEVDLLIRTGKEQRLSDFLLWESAFAELYFPDLYWPEFNPASLRAALDWYQHRNRRFGI